MSDAKVTIATTSSGDRAKEESYALGLDALTLAKVPFLVGGGFALTRYLGDAWRAVKDIDIFIRARDVERALEALSDAGLACKVWDVAWLAKAGRGDAQIDIIFCSYNGLFPVDSTWFANARPGTVLGRQVQFVGPEEIIISKCFVAAHDRFDGGDVAAMIATLGSRLDWERIERRMACDWQVLLWQLIHFVYVFPSLRRRVPHDLLEQLMARFKRELMLPDGAPAGCRGPMLDPVQYAGVLRITGSPDPRPRRDLLQKGRPPRRARLGGGRG
jgi:hypothetical protein